MTRTRLVARRLLTFVVSLLVASAIVFGLINLLPGDVATAMLGDKADQASLDALRAELGLDRNVVVRYADWLGQLLQGNLGRTVHTGDEIATLIGPKLTVTAWLAALGMLLAIALAVPFGMFSAFARRRWTGFVASALSQVGMAVPAFLAAVVLVVLFAVKLRWLPANGYVSMSDDLGDWARHMVLPVVSLALVQASVLSRYVRSAFIEVLAEDWFRTARSVGWTTRRAMVRHGLRNAGLSLVTVIGLQLSTLFVGAIVIESVFTLPGLGRQLLVAVGTRELGLVQAIVMVLVALVLVINAIVDISYVLIDPRLKTSGGEQ